MSITRTHVMHETPKGRRDAEDAEPYVTPKKTLAE